MLYYYCFAAIFYNDITIYGPRCTLHRTYSVAGGGLLLQVVLTASVVVVVVVVVGLTRSVIICI